MVSASAFVFLIGFNLFAIASSKLIKGSLFFINYNAAAKIDENQFFEQIIEFLEFDSSVKQLSKKINNNMMSDCSNVIKCPMM